MEIQIHWKTAISQIVINSQRTLQKLLFKRLLAFPKQGKFPQLGWKFRQVIILIFIGENLNFDFPNSTDKILWCRCILKSITNFGSFSPLKVTEIESKLPIIDTFPTFKFLVKKPKISFFLIL